MGSGSRGAWKAIGAYAAWGLFPFYWKQVAQVPSGQVIAHRIFWSFVTLAVIVAGLGKWRELRDAGRSGKALRVYGAAAVLISANWFTYIWAVSHDLIVETSLGYFITPLVSVALAVAFLRERLRPLQWAAVVCAGASVAYLTWVYGSLPWVALSLAVTFSTYGLVKKLAPLEAMVGLTLETALVAAPALAYLVYSEASGVGAFGRTPGWATLFLAGAGLVTTLPLLLFASALREIPLTLAGIFQYISPTLQLLAGVLVYGEPFTAQQRIGFGGVWIGLVLFALDASFGSGGLWARRRSPRSDPSSLR